jgi:hypothetical protein
MNRKPNRQPHQTSLSLDGGAHWAQLPPDKRDRCRALVVELLARLVRSPASRGADDER